MKSLDEIRKSLIKDDENFEEKDLIILGEKISHICELDKNGNIYFKKPLGDKDKIKFMLIVKFIARKIEDFFADKPEKERISPSVKKEEIGRVLKKPKEQIRARLSDLRKEGFIEDIDRDIHQIKPRFIHKILENE